MEMSETEPPCVERFHLSCWEEFTKEYSPIGICLECMEHTARKQHECDWCSKPIRKGQKYVRLVRVL